MTDKLREDVALTQRDARFAAGRDARYQPAARPILRAATHGDLPSILGLVAASDDRDESAQRLRYWRWKHYENPFGVSPCLVAESHGQIVGVRVFLRWNWQSDNRRVRAVRAVDTATHPDWRGKGVFTRLTMQLVEDVQREGVSFIYNTPNQRSMPGYLKMGWEQVTRIPLWVRAQPSRLVRRAFSSTVAPPNIDGLDPVAAVLDDPRMPAFVTDVAFQDNRYHTQRTLSYLRWRYRDIPGIAYRARFETVGDAGALVIARTRMRSRFREMTISELLVTPSERAIRLGREVVSALANDGTADYSAGCAAKGTAERIVLVRAGFLPVPCVGPHLVARRLALDGLDPLQWPNWRCSVGDLELF